MPLPLHPGVYVVEVPSPARSIEGVSTSTAIFVGETERGPLVATEITNRTDYTRLFGGYLRESIAGNSGVAANVYSRVPVTDAVDGFFQNGGTTAYILRAFDGTASTIGASAKRSVLTTVSPSGPAITIASQYGGSAENGKVFVAFFPSSDGVSNHFQLVVGLTPQGTNPAKIIERWDNLSAAPTDTKLPNYWVTFLRANSKYVKDVTVGVPTFPIALDGTSAKASDIATQIATAPASFFTTTQLSGGIDGPASRTIGTGSSTVAQVVANSPGLWGNRVSAIFAASSDGDTSRFRIFVVYKSIDTQTTSLVETWDRLTATPGDEHYVVDVLNRSLYIRWAPGVTPIVPADSVLDLPKFVYPLTSPAALSPATTDRAVVTLANSGGFWLCGGGGGNAAIDNPDIDQSRYPTILTALNNIKDASLLLIPRNFTDSANQNAFTNIGLDYVNNRPLLDLFFVGDMPPREDTAITSVAVQEILQTDLPTLHANDFGSVFWPWVTVADPIGVGINPTISVAPSGKVAGIFARTDSRRGVWKAPAGVEATVSGTTALDFDLLDVDQDNLNPRGVNALRNIPSAGPVVWGSRTLVPTSQYRYISVRRTAIFLRRSIYNGIQFAVFEPNDEALWSTLRLTVGAFMSSLFRQGAFAGKTAKDAYFVKVDAETTTPADQAAGIVNVWVGFAPLRPAEFVVVQLSQITSQAA
jgi:phage tail sheath protein FI